MTTVTIPPLIRDYLRELEQSSDPLERLRAIRGVATWLRASEDSEIERAREGGMSWQQIGEAQGRPRQVVHRQASKTPYRPRVKGLTSSEYDHVGTPDLRYWLKWWSAPERSPDGVEEAGRDPVDEQQKLKREIAAREKFGVAGRDRDSGWVS
jgi:hypothetical protein